MSYYYYVTSLETTDHTDSSLSLIDNRLCAVCTLGLLKRMANIGLQSSWEQVSDEILCEIFKYLPTSDLLMASK